MILSSGIEAVAATEAVEDTGAGSAKIDLESFAPEEANFGGAYLCLDLPAALFSGGTAQLIEPVAHALLRAASSLTRRSGAQESERRHECVRHDAFRPFLG